MSTVPRIRFAGTPGRLIIVLISISRLHNLRNFRSHHVALETSFYTSRDLHYFSVHFVYLHLGSLSQANSTIEVTRRLVGRRVLRSQVSMRSSPMKSCCCFVGVKKCWLLCCSRNRLPPTHARSLDHTHAASLTLFSDDCLDSLDNFHRFASVRIQIFTALRFWISYTFLQTHI